MPKGFFSHVDIPIGYKAVLLSGKLGVECVVVEVGIWSWDRFLA